MSIDCAFLIEPAGSETPEDNNNKTVRWELKKLFFFESKYARKTIHVLNIRDAQKEVSWMQ